MQRKWLYLGVAALVSVSATGGAIGGHFVWRVRHKAELHAIKRPKAILFQASQTNPGAVIIGDSIVELAALPRVCGMETLNAGISGAGTARVRALASTLLPRTKPRLIVIAVGVNDAVRSGGLTPSRFTAEYRGLVREAQATGAVVVSLTVQPVSSDENKRGIAFDRKKIEKINQIILQTNPRTVNLWSAVQLQGWLPDRLTDDGVHPNPAGYVSWKQQLQRACSYMKTASVRDELLRALREPPSHK